MILVRKRRFNWYEEMHKRHENKFLENKSTPEDARKIILVSLAYDMPLLMHYCLSFALFKSFALLPVSKLLFATKQFCNSENVSKRHMSLQLPGCQAHFLLKSNIKNPTMTIKIHACLIFSFIVIPCALIDLVIALNKSNELMLQILFLLVQEPVAWAKKYGWRDSRLWRNMHVPFLFYELVLANASEKGTLLLLERIGKLMGIRDIPETREAYVKWSEEYCKTHMIPHPTNKKLADLSSGEILGFFPQVFGIRKWMMSLVSCVLDDQTRVALMWYPPEPTYKYLFVQIAVKSFSSFQKWFLLPRSDSNYSFFVDLDIPKNKGEEEDHDSARMHVNRFGVRPWYKAESRTVFGRFVDRVLVFVGWYGSVPSTESRSGDYRLEELGPLHLGKVGTEDVMHAAAGLQGCPITGPFSRRR
ncbi:hypothetical protein NP233_g9825 [Leucocoprinus birnbaumii]|uniref:Uncharacterized protein n=1 Tax=Leucocoprinus birnbaumii TaxID=56174 RepID=A0AAD5VM24_9AGAR|nr:hypothetical protein NP233_g9825 [Leucocoprinus birnbaumii]